MPSISRSISAARLLPAVTALLLVRPAFGQPEAFAGTAYLKQEVRHHVEDRPYGLGRQTMGALFDQCNAFRASAGLPAQTPPTEVLDGVDTEIVERWYDNGRAFTWSQRYGVEPTDLRRYLDDMRHSPGSTPAPPDCSLYRKNDLSSGKLWVDGVFYELRADRKATASRRHPSLKRRDAGFRLPDPLPPATLVLGQSCIPVSGMGPAIQGDSCVWTHFPTEAYLSWPWMLQARSAFGMGAQRLVSETRTLEVSVGRPSPKDRFKLPAGYEVRELH